jgi:exosome complex RNA-binding protein Rrp42 (RNase PH superfamily)
LTYRYVVVDPTAEEESLQNGSIVVVFDEVGTLCSFLKPGGAGLTDQQVDGCMQLARQRTKDIVQMLNKQAK